MKTRFSPIVVAGLFALAAPAAPVFAQSPAGRAPSGATAQQIAALVSATTARLAQEQAKPSSGTMAAPAGGGAATAAANQPTVRLSLEEAVKDALDRNLNIAVQRLNPQTYDYTLSSLRATYLPSVNSTVSTTGQTTPAASQLAGGQSVNATNQTFNAGLTQNSPWAGGSFSLTWNNSRATTSNSFSTFNPAFNTSFLAKFTQPLMRGLRTDSTREQIAVTKLNRDISDIQLKATITNTLSDVRNAYWNLVYAVQAVDVARESLKLANQLVQDNKTRVEVGTMAPIDVVTAQAQAATAQLALVQAESTQRTDELALKQLIVGGTNDPIWDATIDPTDRPEFTPETIDVAAAVKKALADRTDLQIAQKELSSNDVTLKFLHDQVLPQADLVAQYGAQGLGGTQFLRSGLGSGSTVLGTVPGGYTDALSSLGSFNYPTWTVGVTFSYPLGTSTADAAVARARIQMDQTQAQVKQIQLQIATDVTNAAIQVQSSIESVQAARAARELAQQQLDAERSKFDVGMSTNYFVVQALNNLSSAENSELQAILNYRKALVQLDRAEQTTLQSSGVTIVSSGGLNTSAVGSGRPTVVAGSGGGF
ncbi:MAG: TolC family protein [Acidobacteriota bacterium]|nr:TolC family protein [Acidobacteriota bacterium]